MNIDSAAILDFAQAHREEDPQRLMLQRDRYPDIDMRIAVQQIEGMRQALAKWPALARCGQYLYPPRLNREQSSSEATARYKAQLVGRLGGGRVADLTGGMGVDSLFVSQVCETLDYCEQDENLAALCRHNFTALAKVDADPPLCHPNIHCHTGDSMVWVAAGKRQYDTLFIDPARRDSQGRKTVAFDHCTPNLLLHLQMLMSHCRHLVVKASPMIDIAQAVAQMSTAGGKVAEVHILAVGGECKEVDFVVVGDDTTEGKEHTIHCAHLTPTGQTLAHFHFTHGQEAAAAPCFAPAVGRYLYEPDASLMKGGCYNLIGQRYALAQLARNTHLYTGDDRVVDFPGRCFEVLQELPPHGKHVAATIPGGKAHVVVRNYPCSAEELQRRLHLAEGGSLFVVGATVGLRPTVWVCRRREDCNKEDIQ